jgi:hypothetical protein
MANAKPRSCVLEIVTSIYMVFPFGLFVRAIFLRYVKSMRKHSFGVATIFF